MRAQTISRTVADVVVETPEDPTCARAEAIVESRMHNERCTSGSEGERQKLTAAMRRGADARPLLSDALSDGRRFRILCVVDDFSRECLAKVVDTSLTGVRVVRER